MVKVFNFEPCMVWKVKLRFIFILLVLSVLILSVFLILKSLEENVVYFKFSEVKMITELNNKKIRIGGMVKKESVKMFKNEVNLLLQILNEIKVTGLGVIPVCSQKERELLLRDF